MKTKVLRRAAQVVVLGFPMLTAQAEVLLQDAGSWHRIVGEGSLKLVHPHLEKVRIWLEGQARFD